MTEKYLTRMGDGERVSLTAEEIREDLDIGIISGPADATKGVVARCRIAELLDISIHSVNVFKEKLNAPLA